MARARGNRKAARDGDGNEAAPVGPPAGEPPGRLPALPELVRRALSLGLSGFFLTEETIRKALGETLPKDWTDFATQQSQRTRKEFLERLSFEIAQSLESIDLASLARELLDGRTLEIHAELRLRGPEGTEPKPEIRAVLKDAGAKG